MHTIVVWSGDTDIRNIVSGLNRRNDNVLGWGVYSWFAGFFDPYKQSVGIVKRSTGLVLVVKCRGGKWARKLGYMITWHDAEKIVTKIFTLMSKCCSRDSTSYPHHTWIYLCRARQETTIHILQLNHQIRSQAQSSMIESIRYIFVIAVT